MAALVKRQHDLPPSESGKFKPDTVYGYSYIKNGIKPLYSYRKITKGPDKGKFECVYLKKANKFSKIRLARKDIRFLSLPWKRGNTQKLVKRRK